MDTIYRWQIRKGNYFLVGKDYKLKLTYYIQIYKLENGLWGLNFKLTHPSELLIIKDKKVLGSFESINFNLTNEDELDNLKSKSIFHLNQIKKKVMTLIPLDS
ncbi:hypothetical protein [Nostoc sp. CCY 9925]|uniref:hypothetical protein n=1 Tax=Nostoc sp. CCY 9925 TaxID=3103865 RepID=UPI0039C5EA99